MNARLPGAYGLEVDYQQRPTLGGDVPKQFRWLGR
jgi:hypothetical protein